MENTETTTKKGLTGKIVVVIAVLALAAAAYFYYELYTLKQNPQTQALKEAKELTAKVGKLVVLPAEEVPTIATVSDPEALKEQAFFKGATKGDKVLIYAQARKAFLYSVEMNKIIDVAPLNIGSSNAASAGTTKSE